MWNGFTSKCRLSVHFWCREMTFDFWSGSDSSGHSVVMNGASFKLRIGRCPSVGSRSLTTTPSKNELVLFTLPVSIFVSLSWLQTVAWADARSASMIYRVLVKVLYEASCALLALFFMVLCVAATDRLKKFSLKATHAHAAAVVLNKNIQVWFRLLSRKYFLELLKLLHVCQNCAVYKLCMEYQLFISLPFL